MPKLLGITGSIGSGKSTVGEILSEQDIRVIDTDSIVHTLLSNPSPTNQAVINRFGLQITYKDQPGSIDRNKLGRIIFADPQARKDLEAIVHPAVLQELRSQIAHFQDHKIVAVLVPLLFEIGIESAFDEIWTITTNEATLRQRLQQRDKLSDQEINNRLSAQMPQSVKVQRADLVIDNSGSLEQTRQQVTKALRVHKA